MQGYFNKSEKAKGQAATGRMADQPGARISAFHLQDNRPNSVFQRKQMAALVNKSAIPQKQNNTGLADQLKLSLENLSGQSMDEVKVHYHSSSPAQLHAHAYAQGTDIHIASGQEKHLPHEAWHVVQQKQGRVKPTRQLKGGVNINDDKHLEKEADVMGTSAMQLKPEQDLEVAYKKLENAKNIVQRKSLLFSKNVSLQTIGKGNPVQRVLSKIPTGTRDITNRAPVTASTVFSTGDLLYDDAAGTWFHYIASDLTNSIIYVALENGTAPSTYNIGTGALAGVNCADPAELVNVINGIGDITHLITLFGDGFSGGQLLEIFARENDGATIHHLITRIANGDGAHLVQLYRDGANSARITTLLGYETNGATLHHLIQLEATQSPAKIIRLYADGISSAPMAYMLAREPNALTIHNLIQPVNGNFTPANIVFSTMANGKHGSIYFPVGRIKLTHIDGPTVSIKPVILRYTISKKDYQQYRNWVNSANPRPDSAQRHTHVIALPSCVLAAAGAGERLIEFYGMNGADGSHPSRGGPVPFPPLNQTLNQIQLNIIFNAASTGNNDRLRAAMTLDPVLAGIPIN